VIEDKDELFREIQGNFFNISRILDCVSCEKCRLNGKVQIKGLGTAMKLLFTNEDDEFKIISADIKHIKLSRTEVVVSYQMIKLYLFRH
jgi:hypothetical protein